MSDSTFHPLTLAVDLNEWNKVHAERDALRAEVERLTKQVEYDHNMIGVYEAEIERLRALLPQPTENLNLWQVRYREWREAGMPDESCQT